MQRFEPGGRRFAGWSSPAGGLAVHSIRSSFIRVGLRGCWQAGCDSEERRPAAAKSNV